MRVTIRTSRLASWSRRFASFALPLAVIPIFLHRGNLVDSETFGLIESIAMGCAAIGLLLGAAAYVRLWFTGDRGWGRATTGIALGLLCLAPLAVAAFFMQNYPSTLDLTTESNVQIELKSLDSARLTSPPNEEVLIAFPEIRPRDYLLGTNAVYQIVESLMEDKNWQITGRAQPQLEDATGQINALDTTFLGWRDEIAVLIEGDTQRSHVVVRSASGFGQHDLGANGRRIEAFLVALDDAVTFALLTAPVPDSPPVPQAQSSNNS